MAARLSSAQPECVDQSTTDNLSALLTELESGMSLEKLVTEENADISPSYGGPSAEKINAYIHCL